jgi:lysophospholipase L1-like esterase
MRHPRSVGVASLVTALFFAWVSLPTPASAQSSTSAPGCRFKAHFDTTHGQGEPFVMVTVGDSVTWGQGHRLDDSFAGMVQRSISQQYGQAVRKVVYAHSGATIDPIGEKVHYGLHGEINWSTPTINEQVDCVPQDLAAKTDLVLMNGCINDFGAMNIVKPSNDSAWIRSHAETSCERMRWLLPKVVRKFPKALTVVTGYFPLISQKSDPPQVRALLLLFGLAQPLANEDWKRMRDDLSQKSMTWYTVSNEVLQRVVKDHGSGRAVFVPIPFEADNAFGAPKSYLYGFPDLEQRDPVFGGRQSACRVFYGNPRNWGVTNNPVLNFDMTFCIMASAFHPNAQGVAAYRDAILPDLKRIFMPCPRGATGRGVSCIFDQPWYLPVKVIQEHQEPCREQTIRIERHENGQKLVEGKVFVGQQYFAELNEDKRFAFHARPQRRSGGAGQPDSWVLAPTVAFRVQAPGYRDETGVPTLQAPRFVVTHSVGPEQAGRVKLWVYAARDGAFTQLVAAQVIGKDGKVLGETNRELDVAAKDVHGTKPAYRLRDGTILSEAEFREKQLQTSLDPNVRQREAERKRAELQMEREAAELLGERPGRALRDANSWQTERDLAKRAADQEAMRLIADRVGIPDPLAHVWVVGDCFEPTRVAGLPVVTPELVRALAFPRIGVLQTGGNVHVKEGALDATWSRLSHDVQRLVLAGTRVGVLKKDGSLYVKEGPLNAQWVLQSHDVQSFELEGTRIGVLKKDGNVHVKEGPLDATWSRLSHDVQRLVLAGTRVGVLKKDGSLYVKEGPLNAQWTKMIDHARGVALHRVGGPSAAAIASNTFWARRAGGVGTRMLLQGVASQH